MSNPDREEVLIDDDVEVVYAEFRSRQWSDGLPIIPPTPERVARMLAAYHGDRDASLGKIPPSFGEAVVEKIAVAAVMAGCSPRYLPSVVAALTALSKPPFNLGGVQSTTSATAPFLIFNGPNAKSIGMSGSTDCLGGSAHANATIGRAVRLSLISLGGATPGVGDLASLGQPSKLTCCIAENEERSPWIPLSSDRGFPLGSDAVTTFATTGILEVRDSDSTAAEDLLMTIAASMTPAGYMSANNAGDQRPEALVLLTPDHAMQMANQGLDKNDVKQFLWQNARRSLNDFSRSVRNVIANWREYRGLDPTEVTISIRSDDISVVVAGGPGAKSIFVPTWGGWAQSTSALVQYE